jgi:integrase
LRDLKHEAAAAYPEVAAWIVWLDLANKRPKTLYGYTRELAPLLRAHPEKTVGEFTADDINEQIKAKPPRSRHITRSIYNGWFTWLHSQNRIDRTPMAGVPPIPNPRRRQKDIFSPAEIELLEGLPSPDGELWTLLFKTGMRRGEARHLNRAHINLNRARLMVYDGKGGKDRIIPLPPAALAAVADLDLVDELTPTSYLWYSKPGGGRWRSHSHVIGDTTFEHWYRRGIDQAKVRYRTRTRPGTPTAGGSAPKGSTSRNDRSLWDTNRSAPRRSTTVV